MAAVELWSSDRRRLLAVGDADRWGDVVAAAELLQQAAGTDSGAVGPFRAAGDSIAYPVADPLPTVIGHGPTFAQVLANLVANAVKFVPPERTPEVRILAEPRDGQVRLWVEDNGIGIAPEHHERIFRVFERLHRAIEYPGTGIGLAIVRKAMERMGGRSGVVSEPGRGSRFWIELPRAS